MLVVQSLMVAIYRASSILFCQTFYKWLNFTRSLKPELVFIYKKDQDLTLPEGRRIFGCSKNRIMMKFGYMYSRWDLFPLGGTGSPDLNCMITFLAGNWVSPGINGQKLLQCRPVAIPEYTKRCFPEPCWRLTLSSSKSEDLWVSSGRETWM